MLVVRRFSTSHEANLAKMTLESHGIRCHVTGDVLADALSFYGNAVSRVDLLVSPEDAERSHQLLYEADLTRQSERFDQWNEHRGMGWVCNRCDECNELTFDLCWSCAADKPQSPDMRILAPADHPEESLDTEESLSVSKSDESPYRAPSAGSAVVVTPTSDGEIRRAYRAAIAGLYFPPLSLYCLFLLGGQLSRGNFTSRQLAALFLSLTVLLTWTSILLFAGGR